jgi:hypothetical protein
MEREQDCLSGGKKAMKNADISHLKQKLKFNLEDLNRI